jgi:hypothetical protein
MPVAIDMGFPTITLPLSDSIGLTGLFDSCGSLNLGWLPFHLYILSQHPELVAEFRYYDGIHPFEPIQLSGAVLDPNQSLSECGKLIALIRYKTTLCTPTGSAVHISFALGPDVSANTIIGLPFLRALKFVTDYETFTARSKVLSQDFPLTCSPNDRGLPASASNFDPDAFLRTYTSPEKCRIPTSHSPTSPELVSTDAPSPSPPSIAVDDTSHGFLRRTLLFTPPTDAPQTTQVRLR